MRRIIVVAAIVIAVTSLATSQTWSRERASTKPAESVAQCSLTFITESLPDFALGAPVNFQIDVCCGTPPYHFEVVGGTLPQGLHLNRHGKITGVPGEEADTTVFVRVIDRAGCSLTQAFQVRVVAP